jgi:hypothetical protein
MQTERPYQAKYQSHEQEAFLLSWEMVAACHSRAELGVQRIGGKTTYLYISMIPYSTCSAIQDEPAV